MLYLQRLFNSVETPQSMSFTQSRVGCNQYHPDDEARNAEAAEEATDIEERRLVREQTSAGGRTRSRVRNRPRWHRWPASSRAARREM
jgi:hypothetical protein